MTPESQRPRIYVAIGNRTDLSHTGGDVLNEIKLYRRMSSFADVYYNGQLIRFDEEGFGIERRPLAIPEDRFDLYYVRNNPGLCAACPGPLIVTAYPYDKRIWRKADGVLVTTRAWREMLASFNTRRPKRSVRRPWYPRRIVEPRYVLLAEQSLTPGLVPSSHDPRSKQFRARFGLGFRIGYVGRVDPTSFPHLATRAIDRLRRAGHPLSLIFVGTIRDVEIPGWAIVWPREPHDQMRFVTSAFDCLLYDQDDTGHWLGSAKVLEAMACGVPILVRRHAARIEQLGEDYPLYYDSTDEAEALITRLMADPGWHHEISESLIALSSHYDHDAVTGRLGDELQACFDHLGVTSS